MKKVLTGLMVLIWMCIISSFSAQKGSESSATSEKVADIIAEAENKMFQRNWDEIQIGKRGDELQFPVRKCAHMAEYGLLAALVVWHLSYYTIEWKRKLFFAWLFATAYAAADELHQLFVPGRSGSLMDVAVDSAGALLGISFLFICHRIYRTGRKKET